MLISSVFLHLAFNQVSVRAHLHLQAKDSVLGRLVVWWFGLTAAALVWGLRFHIKLLNMQPKKKVRILQRTDRCGVHSQLEALGSGGCGSVLAEVRDGASKVTPVQGQERVRRPSPAEPQGSFLLLQPLPSPSHAAKAA